MKISFFALACCALAATGCGSPTPDKDNATMRDTLSGKPFDINNVPPENRAMVLKMRGGAGASRPGAAAQAPGGQPPAGAPPKTGP